MTIPLSLFLRAAPAFLLSLVPVLAGGLDRSAAPTGRRSADLPTVTRRDVKEVRLAVTPDGRPTLAWIEDTRRPGERFGQDVFVARFEGGAWTRLGGSLNYLRPRDATTLDLALDERGAPLLAWNENFAHVDMHRFRAFLNGAWTDWDDRYLGQDLTYAARVRALAAFRGAPVLAWGEQNTDTPGTRLFVQTWDGRTWARLPALNSGARVALLPSVAVGGDGRPVVAWLEGDAATSDVLVKRWTGSAWAAFGGPLNVRPRTYTYAPALRLDAAGRPVVAWLEDANGVDTLFVKRWTGSAWEALGGPLNVARDRPAERPSLALGPGGAVVVAWSEGLEGARRVFARRWTSRGWAALGGGALSAPGRDADSAAVAMDARGRVFAAWRERRAGGHVAVVREVGRVE